MSVQNVIAGMMQVMRPKLQEFMEMSTTAASLIKAGTEVYQIGKQDFRMPLIVQNGGDFGGFNLDGGNLGRGSAMKMEQLVQTYYPTKLGLELTLESMYVTENSKVSIVNTFKETLKRGMAEAQVYDDLVFHAMGSGNQGQIGSVASAAAISSGTQVLTLDANFGSQLFRKNMPVEVWDSTLTTQRTAAGSPDNLPRVLTIDPIAKTVTLTNVTPTTNITAGGVQANDAITFTGNTTTGYISGSPVFRQGLRFFNTTTTSGSFLGLSRTTYPDLNSNYVAAGGSLLPMHGLLLKHRILQRKGEVPELKGLVHPAQVARIVEQNMALSVWQRGKSDGPIDVLPNVGNDITWCGIPMKTDIRQDRSRIDFISPKTWGRARLKDLDWLDIDGQRVFEVRASNGGLVAAVLMYLMQVENFYCVDPAAQGFIHTLSLPSGY